MHTRPLQAAEVDEERLFKEAAAKTAATVAAERERLLREAAAEGLASFLPKGAIASAEELEIVESMRRLGN
jgi:hypothetical protein